MQDHYIHSLYVNEEDNLKLVDVIFCRIPVSAHVQSSGAECTGVQHQRGQEGGCHCTAWSRPVI